MVSTRRPGRTMRRAMTGDCPNGADGRLLIHVSNLSGRPCQPI